MAILVKKRTTNGTKRVSKSFDKKVKKDKSRTQQHFKDQCNINTIMKKYIKTGMLPVFKNATSAGVYGDFSNIGTFQECQNRIIELEHKFMQIPSEIRKRFDNDPQKMLDFIADPKNEEEAIKLKLLDKKPLPKLTEAEIKAINEKEAIKPPETPSE
jgi:phage internal scaffolding protein